MAAGNNANDQLFTAKEQIIPPNTFAKNFAVQRI